MYERLIPPLSLSLSLGVLLLAFPPAQPFQLDEREHSPLLQFLMHACTLWQAADGHSGARAELARRS